MNRSKFALSILSLFLMICVAWMVACQKESSQSNRLLANGQDAPAGKPAGKLDAPSLQCAGSTPASITLLVTAGPSGAAAGFTVQWMLASEYALGPDGLAGTKDDNSFYSTASSYCGASFSGVPGASQFTLGANQSVEVTIGDVLFDQVGASSSCENVPLTCGNAYVFRSFAHTSPSGSMKSDFSSTQTCSTTPCSSSGGCTYTQGFWKTHGAAGPAGTPLFDENGVQTGYQSLWPVSSLTLGSVSYTETELQAIYNTPAAGNGLISLAHQLIAAKLNIANGADDTDIASTIQQADNLIGALIIPPVGAGSLSPSSTSALVSALTAYNEGTTGPGHCQ